MRQQSHSSAPILWVTMAVVAGTGVPNTECRRHRKAGKSHSFRDIPFPDTARKALHESSQPLHIDPPAYRNSAGNAMPGEERFQLVAGMRWDSEKPVTTGSIASSRFSYDLWLITQREIRIKKDKDKGNAPPCPLR
jgi:hypothetical protein